MFAKSLKIIIIFFLSSVIAACNTLHTPASTMQPLRIGLHLPPSSLGKSLTLQQHLTVERAGQKHELDAALDINPQQLNLIFLAFGQRIMTVDYDGEKLQVWRNSYLPAQVRNQIRGEDILEDLQLSLWPAETIRKALPAGWRIKEQRKKRVILFNNMSITEITYTDKSRWNGTIVLSNLRYNYRLIIQSIKAGD